YWLVGVQPSGKAPYQSYYHSRAGAARGQDWHAARQSNCTSDEYKTPLVYRLQDRRLALPHREAQRSLASQKPDVRGKCWDAVVEVHHSPPVRREPAPTESYKSIQTSFRRHHHERLAKNLMF